MKQQTVILFAREADVPDILSIYASCQDNLPPLDPDGFLRLLRHNLRRSSVLLAVRGERASGVCIYSPVLRRISLLAVLPEARGMGVATALLDEALRQLPPGDVSVETFCDDDMRGTAALALYRKAGFHPVKRLYGYEYPMQELRLCRK